VGVVYFSSARARVIGSTRPNSLNELKKSLFLIWRNDRAAFAAGGIAGF
jgi:hypothetical protein